MPKTAKKKSSPEMIAFSLERIVTEQFATFTNIELQGDMIVSANVKFGINSGHQSIICGFNYQMEVSEKPFLIIEISCLFKLESESWNRLVVDNMLHLSRGFARHMGVITAGTTRGVLHAKTENTVFNQYPLALVNVEELLEEDIQFEL